MEKQLRFFVGSRDFCLQVNRETLAADMNTEIETGEWEGFTSYCDQVIGGSTDQSYDIEHELILDDESYIDLHFLQLVTNSFIKDSFKAYRLFNQQIPVA